MGKKEQVHSLLLSGLYVFLSFPSFHIRVRLFSLTALRPLTSLFKQPALQTPLQRRLPRPRARGRLLGLALGSPADDASAESPRSVVWRDEAEDSGRPAVGPIRHHRRQPAAPLTGPLGHHPVEGGRTYEQVDDWRVHR